MTENRRKLMGAGVGAWGMRVAGGSAALWVMKFHCQNYVGLWQAVNNPDEMETVTYPPQRPRDEWQEMGRGGREAEKPILAHVWGIIENWDLLVRVLSSIIRTPRLSLWRSLPCHQPCGGVPSRDFFWDYEKTYIVFWGHHKLIVIHLPS